MENNSIAEGSFNNSGWELSVFLYGIGMKIFIQK